MLVLFAIQVSVQRFSALSHCRRHTLQHSLWTLLVFTQYYVGNTSLSFWFLCLGELEHWAYWKGQMILRFFHKLYITLLTSVIHRIGQQKYFFLSVKSHSSTHCWLHDHFCYHCLCIQYMASWLCHSNLHVKFQAKMKAFLRSHAERILKTKQLSLQWYSWHPKEQRKAYHQCTYH